MIFVLDFTIAILVWLPFTVGKALALLAVSCEHSGHVDLNAHFLSLKLNPRRSMQLLHLPLRAIRFITDPIVDFVLYVIAHTVVPPLIRLGESMAKIVFSALATFVGEKAATKLQDYGIEMVRVMLIHGHEAHSCRSVLPRPPDCQCHMGIRVSSLRSYS